MSFKGLGKQRTGTMTKGALVALLSLLALRSECLVNLSHAEDLTPAEYFFESDAKKARAEKIEKEEEEEAPIGSVIASQDPAAHLTPPDARAQMRVNPEAPGPFIGLATAYFSGDMETAKAYSKQFVQYLTDLTFAVKDITRMIGQAMIEAKQIDEEQWDGVEQYLDYELAKSREATGSPFKVTHEDTLKRINPDPKGEVEVYYFFTLNSQHARKMAPQVERLWQIAKSDSRIKMVALTLGEQPKEWVESYKRYTGLTLPIMNGELVAKSFDIRFVPAIVVVTPNAPAAYVRTGQSDFTRLYQFVRKAQGLDMTLDSKATRLLQVKIGQEEKAPRNIEQAITELEKGKGPSLLPAKGTSSLREKLKALSF